MASYSDNFNRASLGADWTTVNGGTWSIASSTYLQQTNVAGVYRGLRYNSVLDSDDVDVTIEGYAVSGSGVGVVVRAPNTGTTSTSLDGYGVVFFPNDGFYLVRFDNGSDDGIGYSYIYGYPTPMAYYTLRIVANGSTITGYIDGTQRFEVTDTTYSGSGNRSVVLVSYGANARFDDFTAIDVVSSQTVSPNLHTNSNTFYSPTVSLDTGAQNLTANLLTNTSTFHSPTLVQEQNVAPDIVRRTNRSIKFNGNGADVNRIRIPLEDGVSTQYPINVGATHFTTEGWVRANYSENATTATDEDARYSNIIYDRDSWGEQRGHVWGVTRSGTDLIACFGQAGSGGSWTTIFSTTNIGDGEWHHLAITRNQTTGVVKIWVDGVEEASGTYDTTDWSFPAGHTVGSGQDNEYLVLGTEKHDVGFYYTGELDEFRVSNEVKYTSTFTPSRQLPVDDGVVGLYRADEGSGTVFFDETLNTNGELLVGGSPSGPTWIDLESNYNIFFNPSVAVGEITLLPDVLTNTNTFHTPTVSTGAVTVAPNLLTNTNTFYTPTVSAGATTVVPNLLSNSSTIHSPTVTPGSVTVTANALENSSFVQEPTITVGFVTVSPNVLTNTNTFYSPTVGSFTSVEPNLLTNTNTLHKPTITTGSVDVVPDLLVNTNTFYTASLDGSVTLQPDALTNTSVLYTPTVSTGAVTVTTNTLNNTSVFYQPIVDAGSTTITPDVLSNSNTIYTPTITTGSVNVVSELLTNTNTFFEPTITTGSVEIVPDNISNSNTIYSPVVSSGGIVVAPDVLNNTNTIYGIIVSAGAVDMAPDLLENTNQIFAPDVVQGVTTDLLENTNQVFAPALTQNISTQILINTSGFYSPEITTGATNIETDRVESTTQFHSPWVYIGGATTLTADLLVNTSVFYNPTLVDRYGRINRVSATSRTSELSSTTREYDILVN